MEDGVAAWRAPAPLVWASTGDREWSPWWPMVLYVRSLSLISNVRALSRYAPIVEQGVAAEVARRRWRYAGRRRVFVSDGVVKSAVPCGRVAEGACVSGLRCGALEAHGGLKVPMAHGPCQ